MRRFFVSLAMIAIVLAPLGASANDRQIAEQIVRSLKQRKAAGELQGFNIDLQVDKGAVWLKGHVSKPEQEQLALDIARRVEGVEKVYNQIEIRSDDADAAPAAAKSSRRDVKQAQLLDTTQHQQLATKLASAEEDIDDGQEESRRIAQALVTQLRAEQNAGNLAKFGIDIQVDKGTLWLKGEMASEEHRHTVLEIARRISGVKQVVNELSVKTREIAAEPKLAVQPTPAIAPTTSRRRPQPQQPQLEPIAAVEPATVEPTIAEPSPVAAEAIAEPIATAPNQSQQITDEVLRRLATQKTLGSLHEFGIDVQVDDGVVWMSGFVADAAQRALALDMARYVRGVKQVVDDLTVNSDITKTAEQAAPNEMAKPVAPATDPSQQITDEVLRRLATQKTLGSLREFGIDVQVDDGVVWMSGYVADAAQRVLALDMARYVRGVKQVVDDLTVNSEVAESDVQLVAHPIAADASIPVEPQQLQPLRPTAVAPQVAVAPEPVAPQVAVAPEPVAPQVAAAPQAVALPQAAAAPQATANQQAVAGRMLPQGMSFVPATPTSLPAGWTLVNTGQQASQVRPVSNQMQTPIAFAPARPVNYTQMQAGGQPAPMMGGHGVGVAPARYDHPQLPGYAWPSYAAHPNYGAVTYPKQYSAQAWPYIGPFYPYPQVPLGWRKVTLEWDDGWWQLDFKDR